MYFSTRQLSIYITIFQFLHNYSRWNNKFRLVPSQLKSAFVFRFRFAFCCCCDFIRVTKKWIDYTLFGLAWSEMGEAQFASQELLACHSAGDSEYEFGCVRSRFRSLSVLCRAQRLKLFFMPHFFIFAASHIKSLGFSHRQACKHILQKTNHVCVIYLLFLIFLRVQKSMTFHIV